MVQEWRHGLPADHEPVPVPRMELFEENVEKVCDFCGGAAAHTSSWVYPTRPFVWGSSDERDVQLNDDSGDGWAACKSCHDLIRAGNRDALSVRAAKRISRIKGEPETEWLKKVRVSHATFFTARDGKPVRSRDYHAPNSTSA